MAEVWVVDLNGNRHGASPLIWIALYGGLCGHQTTTYNFRAESEGTEDIYEVSLNNSVRRITEGEKSVIISPSMDVKKDIIAYRSGDIHKPTEMYVYDLESGAERRVTHLNDDFLREIELLEPVEFWFNASDGTPIQGGT